MTVSPTPRPAARAVLLAVPAAAAAVLLAAAAGALDARRATAAAVAAGALWAAGHLVRTALAIHRADGTYAACRGAGFVGMGALGCAVAAACTGVAGTAAAAGAATAVVAAAACLVLGTSLMPGAAGSPAVRLRRLFDGLALGVSLCFAAYLATPLDTAPGAVLPATLATALGVAGITVFVLRGRTHRAAALRCGAGAAAALASSCAAANLAVVGAAGPVFPLLGLVTVAGLTTAAAAAAHRGATDRTPAAEPEQYLSSYPLLAVPAAVGVLAAVYHLLTAGPFDRTAAALGIAMVSLLTMRELLVVRDIRAYAARLREKEAHFRSLVAGATDLTLTLDDELRVTWLSPAAARLFGLQSSDVVGRPFRDLVHPDDAAEAAAVLDGLRAGERPAGPPVLIGARLRDGAGLWRDTESTVADQRAVPEVAALVVHVRDVGERRHLERTLHRMSASDQLTGLANRRALMRDLLAYRRRAGHPGTLLVVDLHGLAEINDERGREVGDAVLVEVGRRIRSLTGERDVPARLGGDEFAVLTPDGAVLAYALATRLVSRLLEPYELPGSTVGLHVSVGLAELAGGADCEEVLRHADLARTRARQLGRDRVEWYDPDTERALLRRMELERQIVGAADRGELDVVFQPVLALRDGRPAGVEALLRWRHPTLGTVTPAELLPVARAVGVAARLDAWVLDAACRHLASWSTLDDGFWLSVNVSPRELLTDPFADRVAATLARYGLAADRLVVEVAETWIAEDVPAVVAALAELRRHGVRAALDDFGAGQASLSHLRRLPVDVLKLDASLIRTPADDTGPAVLDVVAGLGRRLGLETVAKGLETTEQVDRARRAGCAYGQGFVLARPEPAERVEAYLDAHRAGRA